MRFKVYGPYEIGVEKGFAGWIDEEDAKDFWGKSVDKVVDNDSKKLSEACGVYLFGIGGVEGRKTGTAGQTLPWYVGKAERQSFKKECFTHRNLFYFNRALFKEYKGKGKPFLYLLARVEKKEKNDEFSEPASQKQFWGVRLVEEMFIQLSLSINSELVNKQMTKMIRETSIRGLLNTRKYKSDSVDELKSLFGIKHEPADVADYKEVNFRYEIHGPLEVPVNKVVKVTDKAIDSKRLEEMWSTLGKERNGCGVYVIGIRNKGNTKPWYVDVAFDKSFEEKCFESFLEREKIVKKKGTLVIYFLPRLTKKKKDFELAKRTTNMPRDMKYVKDVLLDYGVQANKDILLEGERNAEILRDLYIQGFVKSEKGDFNKDVVKKLRKLLGR